MYDKISETKINFFKKKIVMWGRENYFDFPWRTTQNHWHALVAEIMLQRTNALQVVPVYLDFTKRYKTPSDYMLDENIEVFESLGLHWREKLLRELAQTLATQKIPANRQELLKLPAIGDYIASAYLSMHLNKFDRIIDSNVVRLYGRYFGFTTDGETRRKRWLIELAEKLTPPRIFRDYNYALLDFTREICKPKPLCEACPLNKHCAYYQASSF